MSVSRIGILCGGFSHERAVSLRSGANVQGALQTLGYDTFLLDPATDRLSNQPMDLAFNVLHGTFGEDGHIQSLLEHLGYRYTGSGVKASVLGMNKLSTKLMLASLDLPTLPWQLIRPETLSDGPDPSLPYPMIIKPLSEGSSVGVNVIHSPDNFKPIATHACRDYGPCLIEPFIDGMELTISVLEKEGRPFALPILALETDREFYDYTAKYTPDLTRFILPAPLPDTLTRSLQAMAIHMHTAFGCRGVSRVDMMLDMANRPSILEINTVPGMTNTSDLPAQAAEAGLSFDNVVQLIIDAT